MMENPNSSYESWIASCHPENVNDKRFLIQENNPWWTVWEQRYDPLVVTKKTTTTTKTSPVLTHSKNQLEQVMNNAFNVLGKVNQTLEGHRSLGKEKALTKTRSSLLTHSKNQMDQVMGDVFNVLGRVNQTLEGHRSFEKEK